MLATKMIELWLKRWWWAIALPVVIITVVGIAFDIRILMTACMIMMVLYPALLLGAFARILKRKQRRATQKPAR